MPGLAAARNVVFIGGGGHAAVCLDVFRSCGRHVIGYVAPQPGELDCAHLGDDTILDGIDASTTEVFVAIGSNKTRVILLDRLRTMGIAAATAIDRNAIVSPSASIGDGSVVMPGAIVNARSVVGSGVILNTASSIDHDCVLDDAVHIGPGSHLAGWVTVGRGALVGVGVSVIPGCTIGPWAVVGAGGCVVGDIEEDTVNVGVPAKAVRRKP